MSSFKCECGRENKLNARGRRRLRRQGTPTGSQSDPFRHGVV